MVDVGGAVAVDRPWQLDVAAVASSLATDVVSGLTDDDAADRLARWGSNELEDDRHRPLWRLAVEQFTNTMILVLVGAAVITAFIGDFTDTVVIGAIVVLNAAFGFAQEYKAEQALAMLRKLTAQDATVVRGGVDTVVPAADLVPGDVVVLTAGAMVPADVRLVDVAALRIDEATLTGESEPAAKLVDALGDLDDSMVADRRNMAFKGTAVTFGRGRGVVVATGSVSELGRIATMLHSDGVTPTVLQRRLAVVARRMAGAAVVVCVVVFVVGIARGEPVEQMFLTAVSLAVAAIPEGLPAVITVALALGARRMADRHALVRKLAAVETLGSVSVICTDKTGTLTENRMLVERVWCDGAEHTVTGRAYEPVGTIEAVDGTSVRADALRALVEVAVACNDAALHAPADAASEWSITGDPTEGALLALAGKIGVERASFEAACPRIAELAFDAERRRMSTVHRRAGGHWVATKGALESLTPLIVAEQREVVAEATAVARRWAAAGFRVLALADRSPAHVPDGADTLDELETGLRFVGLVAIADPPRPQVAGAIAECARAGITPVIITGDHALTASAIAGRVGLTIGDGGAITGTELADLDDAELDARVEDVQVYARVSPEQKLRIVDAWQRRGAVVAMTGDGVNDAPALRRADTGVAMGMAGTDVSREAADIVLADDDFATIVAAVEEGRRIYDNIRRFVRYLLTTNSGEVWVMFLAPLVGLPVPLLPVQILWINLVTDGFPAIALGLEPAEPDTMSRPPRPPTESLFAHGLWQHAVWVGLLMAATVLPLQAVAREMDWEWQTMVFTTLALLQLGHAMAARSELRSLRSLGLRTNPWLLGAVGLTIAVQAVLIYVPAFHSVFGTAALGPAELAVVLVASTTVFIAVEIEKWWRRTYRR